MLNELENLSISQCARFINKHPNAIYNAIKKGELIVVDYLGRKYINRNALIIWNNKRSKNTITEFYEPFIFDNPVPVLKVEQPFCTKCDGYGYFYKKETNTYHRCPMRDSQPIKHAHCSSTG